MSKGEVSSTGDDAKGSVSINEQLKYVEKLCNQDYNYAEACELSRKIVVQDTNNAQGWFWFGYSAHRILSPKEAKAAYLKAIELNSVRAYLNLGILYSQHGWYLKAMNYYRVALKKDAKLWEVYAGLGDVYRENAAYNNAIKNYDEAVRLNPKDKLSQDYLSLCCDAQGELNESGVVSEGVLKRLANLSITPRWEGLPPAPGITPFQVRFRTGKYRLEDLSENDRRQLAEVAQLLSSQEWQWRKFVIEGYTCPCGDAAANKVLSQKRAETAKAYLIEHSPISAENLFVRGYGEENPIVECRNKNLSAQECERDEEHLMNRRVLLRVWLRKEPPPTDWLNILGDDK